MSPILICVQTRELLLGDFFATEKFRYFNFALNTPFYRTFYFLVAWADRWANATRRSKVEKAKKHIQEYKSKRHAKGKH